MRRWIAAAAWALLLLVPALGFAQDRTPVQAGRDASQRQSAQALFKEGNAFFTQQDYARAAEKYKQAVEADPTFATPYFYLANSYDQLFLATRRGDPTNDAYLTLAIDNYWAAADKGDDPRIKRLALQYLVNASGPEKLNDPTLAVRALQRLIELDPGDTGPYFALGKMYEDAGRYEQAEAYLNQARALKPKDPTVYGQLAGFFNRQGDFERTIAAYRQWQAVEPDNPEVYYTIGSFYWDKVYRDARMSPPQKREYVAIGEQAVAMALQLRPDYFEALNRMALLLRQEAALTEDKGHYDERVRQADELMREAQDLQQKKIRGELAGAVELPPVVARVLADESRVAAGAPPARDASPVVTGTASVDEVQPAGAPPAQASTEGPLLAPVTGLARVGSLPMVTEVAGDCLKTTVRVKNLSLQPIATLTVEEVWFDTAGTVVPGGAKESLRAPLLPGQTATFVFMTRRGPAMAHATYQFAHARGTVTVQRLEVF